MGSEFSEAVKRCKANHVERDRLMREDPKFRATEEERIRRIEDAELAAKAAAVQRAREAKGIPPRAWPFLDGGGHETEAIREVRGFLACRRPPGAPQLTMLFLGGGEGTGKTIAACTALERQGGLFVKAGALPRARMEPADWARMAGAYLLVIDDLAASYEDDKGFVVSAFYEMIDLRYDALGKTIVTCNLTADKFRERYCMGDGGRLAGRIRESGSYLEFDGESLRKRS